MRTMNQKCAAFTAHVRCLFCMDSRMMTNEIVVREFWQLLDRKGYKMVHAETGSLLQMLKQAQKMEELLKQVKPDSGLSVGVCYCLLSLCLSLVFRV